MVDYNPDQYAVIGPQLTPRTTVAAPYMKPIGGAAEALVETFLSAASATVNGMGKVFKNLTSTETTLGTRQSAVVEVLAAGSEVATNVAQATYLPNASSQSDVGGGEDYTDLLPGGFGVHNSPSWEQGTIDLDFATAGVLAGKRILRVRFVFEATGTADSRPAELRVDLDGENIASYELSASGTSPLQTIVIDSGEIVPMFALSWPLWTVAQLQEFDAGTFRLRFTLGGHNDSGLEEVQSTVRITNVRLLVDYCDENRLAADVVAVPAGPGEQFITWTPHTPAGAVNWSKVNATSYTVVTRAPRAGNTNTSANIGGSQIGVVVFPTRNVIPAGLPVVRQEATTHPNGQIISLGPVDPFVYSPLELRVSSTVVADSQVYNGVFDAVTTPWTTLQQEFTQSSGSPVTVVGVRLIGRYLADADGTVSNCTVTLRKRSDDSVVATGTLTAAMVDAASEEVDTGYGRFALIQVPFAAGFAMVSGTQYYVDITSTDKPDWYFPVLTMSSAASAPAQGWHGTTDVGTYNSESSTYDFPWLLYQTVVAPTGLSATPNTLDVEDIGGDFGVCEGCLVTGIGYIHLAWTATSLGGLFGRYVIERQDDYTTWEVIGYVTTESTVTFNDYEARLGVVSEYRISVETDVGISSAVSSSVTAEAPVNGKGLTFTNNAIPSASVGYTDVYGDGPAERDWDSPEADELSTQRMSGRDYVVAFQPCERRGLSFTRTLLVNVMTAPSMVGIHAFDALRDLAKSSAPYVCVRDQDGDRWYTAMTVPNIRIRNPGASYHATVSMVEVQGVATPAVFA